MNIFTLYAKKAKKHDFLGSGNYTLGFSWARNGYTGTRVHGKIFGGYKVQRPVNNYGVLGWWVENKIPLLLGIGAGEGVKILYLIGVIQMTDNLEWDSGEIPISHTP